MISSQRNETLIEREESSEKSYCLNLMKYLSTRFIKSIKGAILEYDKIPPKELCDASIT